MSILLTKKANEESTYVVKVYFYDEDGNSYIPVTASWTLQDSDGTVINSRSNVSLTPAAYVNIVLSGDDLAIPTSDYKRLLLVKTTYNSAYGNNLPFNEEIEFEIQPLVGIT